jgi:hypothetical protein
MLQDKVEVRYLQGDKVFPRGFQPACALKDGYLLFATAPDAILQFRPGASAPAADDVPLLRISTRGLASLLRQRREQIVDKLTRKQHLSATEAEQNVLNLAEFLDLFDHVTLSRRTEPGQAEWLLRVDAAAAASK